MSIFCSLGCIRSAVSGSGSSAAQEHRLAALFATEGHVEVEATWGIYQRMIAAYREPDRKKGRQLMQAVIESVSSSVPAALTELITLRRTLNKIAADVSPTSTGPAGATARQRRSTDAWSTCAALPSASAT